MTVTQTPFPNFMQLRAESRVPSWMWQVARILGLVIALGLVLMLFIAPAMGLKLFWGVAVPVLPLVFVAAPGLWRNTCPMATLNQLPRLFNLTRGLTLPKWLQEYGYVIGFILFFVLASSRKWLFNSNGAATGILMLAMLAAAGIGGLFFKGKSGWCSNICPLLPVQRLYNQTPFSLIGNSHCAPCVGCTKNCYDFNPRVATLADHYDDDPYYRNYRRFFAAAFPGFIIAFFTLPSPPTLSIPLFYAALAAYLLASVGVYYVVDTFVKATPFKITTGFGALALNLFYWFVIPLWLGNVTGLLGSAPGALPLIWLAWLLRLGLLTLTLIWLQRSFAKEPIFIAQLMPSEPTRVSAAAVRVLDKASEGAIEVVLAPDERRLLTEPKRTLLEVAERNDVRIEAGCRMGVCGADPIAVLSGVENLGDLKADEKSTLERLGLGGNARMACMARVHGPVTFTLDLKQAKEAAAAPAQTHDENVHTVVIIGNGVAGVTAADYVRRYHPTCEINLIGRESHHFYNRMGIARLIYGRSAMNGLFLQPHEWYEQKHITAWLNTSVQAIDPDRHRVSLATGEELPYDRLILATGSSSYVPPIAGFDRPGCFVLREADDAIALRAYIQTHRARHAVVAGGGLLGLEAAYALKQLGMRVTVLERSDRLLKRQLDVRGSALLRQYLEALGMAFVLEAECAAAEGSPAGDTNLAAVSLKDGRQLPAEVLLVAAGIRPNTDIAQAMGLACEQGIIVDAGMRASLPDIFAAGDVCQFEGKLPGLWPVAVEQAKVAAINAVGGDQEYTPVVPVTTLKVAGVDLTSIGRIEARDANEQTIALEDGDNHFYRKLVLADNKIAGAILLGYPQLAPAVTAAIKQQRDVEPHLQSLQRGDWSVLEQTD